MKFVKILRGLLKFFLVTGISLIALIALVLIALQTPPVKSLIKSIVVDRVNEQLNARLTIDELDGNFLSSVDVRGVRLAFGDTTLVSLGSISIRFDALAALDRRIHIESVHVDRPYVNVHVDTAGVLNLSRIAKPSLPKPPEPIDSTAEPLGGFALELDDFAIDSGRVDVRTPGFNARIERFGMELNADANAEFQNVALTQFGFEILRAVGDSSDTLRLKNLSVIAGAHALPRPLAYRARHPEEKDSLWIKLDELHLQTDRTDVRMRAEVTLPDSAAGQSLGYAMSIAASPIHLGEVRRVVPFGLSALRRIDFETDIRGDDNSVLLSNLQVKTDAGSIRGYAGIDFADGPLGYRTELNFSNVQVGAFLDRPDFSAVLNGRFFADGIGTNPDSLKSDVSLSLARSTFFDIAIDTFDVRSYVRDGIAHLTRFEGRTSAGDWDCEGFYRLRSEAYHLVTDFRGMNVADFTLNPALKSSINLKLVVDGQGLNPQTSTTRLSIVSESSTIFDRTIDNVSIQGSKQQGRIVLEDFRIETPVVDLSVAGSVGLDSTVDMQYAVKSRDIGLLKKYTGLDSLLRDTIHFEMEYKGGVRGSYRQLETSGELRLSHFIFGDFKIDSVFFSYFVANILPDQLSQVVDFRSIDETIYGDVFIYTRTVDAGGTTLRDFTTSLTKERRKTSFEVSGYQDQTDAYASLKGNLVMQDENRGELQLDNLHLRIAGRTLRTREVKLNLGGEPVIDSTFERWSEVWENSRPVQLAFDLLNQRYDIKQFSMNIGSGVMSVFGTIDVKGDQNLDVKIKDLNLARANSVIGSGESVIEGILNLNASLKGNFEKPIILADWNITDGKAAQFTYVNFLGNVQYLNRKLQMNMSLNQNADKTLTMSGYLPVDLSFKDVPERFPNRPINLIVHSEGIDLRFLQAFFGKSLTLQRGELKVDLKVTGKRETPKLEGELKIEDGTVTFPKSTLGQTFRNARFFVKLTPETIFIDTVYLQSGRDARSNLKARAKINLADLMKNFDVSRLDQISYDASIAFNDFQPVNTKSETAYLHSAHLTGDMQVSASSLSFPVIKGDLQIRNSEIWVVDPTKAKVVTTVSSGKSSSVQDATAVNYYRNLDLDVSISLPDNTENAVKSAEMILYLLGDIQVVKPSGSDDFFISGNVSTKPGGKYAYLNAAFTVEKGDVIFTGEPGVNPELDILAIKKFTYTDEDKQAIPATAQIRVTGKLLKPEIAITAVQRGTDDPIDGLTEPADIISYIVLGVKTSDLAKIGGQAGDFAKDVAINQILNAVARQGGFQKLEYQSGGDGQSATIAVSKQISETVSVSFEGGLDANSAQNLTLEIAADSLVPVFRSWKKTIEFEFKKPSQDATSDKDIINVIFYFRKEY